ncbi:zinc finger CCCH domain-containing protein 55-like [Telopea speciosissima]|uniref:zinc finger CCCH domain-containing protein 55-like n=1 Tax=Telopea speciosissima TaxID=54955 RepID=UPI001CC7E1A4|nr:zinc finger CCCH domain-containing protein 55-like [Telopea speciosissima]
MTERVKKRNSKWDLVAETDVPAERHENIWPDKAGESIHNKESSSEWNSLKVAISQHPRWSNMEANKIGEQLPGKGNAEQDESPDRDPNEISRSTTRWGRDKSYSSSVSPGLDAWRDHNQSHSPKSNWRLHRSRSRSRSRSPLHDFKWESEHWRDRSRSGSGVSAPTCNDFAAGRCRRGSQCRYLHQDNHDYGGRGHSERGRVERCRGRRENGPISESGGSWGSRHERGSFSRHSNDEEPRDYSRDMIAQGYRDREHELPRNNRSANLCNDFLKGKCSRGSSCKYAHYDVLGDGHGGWSPKDVTRERVHDRMEVREYDHGREPSRNNGIPCKFFAVGKCNKGSNCRFSHDGPGRCSPEGRCQGDRWGQNLDNDKSWGDPKWGDTTVAPHVTKDDRLGLMTDNEDSWGGPKRNDTAPSYDVAKDDKWGHNLGNEPDSWGGPKWSDTAAGTDVVKSPHCRTDNGDGKVGFNETCPTKRSADDQWGHSSDNKKGPWGGPRWIDKAAGQEGCRSPHQSENDGATVNVPESIGGSKPLVSATSAAADIMEQHPFYIAKVEQGQVPQDSQSQTPNGSLFTCEQNTTQVSLHQHQHSNLKGDAAIAFPCTESNILPMVPMPQSFNHDGQNGRGSGFNLIRQSEQIDPPHPPSGRTLDLSGKTQTLISGSPSNRQGHTPFHMGEPITKSETVDAKTSNITSVGPLNHNVVTSERVAHITTNLSASLAQIFGNGQQLPQLYAALNPLNSIGMVPSQPNPAGTSTTVTLPSNDPNQTTWSQKPYDPMGASIESNRPDINDQPPLFSSSPVERNEVADQMPLKSSAPLSLKNDFSEETLKNESHESKQLEPLAAGEVAEKNEVTDQRKKEQVNGYPEDMDVDGRVDEECKSSKDVKGMRMFKFALVEFVKEILKPTWKEGQMSKEAHKTIVKKVVDKVTGTIQGVHVPQTQEKIDQYLSYSKPKLTKLVQAYVEKYLKS